MNQQEPPRSRPPRAAGHPLTETTLAPLCRQVGASRRVAFAEKLIADELRLLAARSWRVERGVHAGGHRVPFLPVGETGMFAVWGLDSTPSRDEVVATSKAVGALRSLLPGYRGRAVGALCQPFVEVRPRVWHLEGGASAWVIGKSSLIAWLEHFGPRGGLTPDDLVLWDQLVASRRTKRQSSSLPSEPSIG